MIKTACCTLLTACFLSIATPIAAAPNPTAASFDALKELVGVWRQSDKPDSPLRIRFSLTAGGTVIMEEWLRGTQPHSLTLYHRNGATVVATHYCPQANQPRLTLSAPTVPDVLRFTFQDATDLDAVNESYLVALAFDLSHKDRITRSETYRQTNNDELSELHLVRDNAAVP